MRSDNLPLREEKGVIFGERGRGKMVLPTTELCIGLTPITIGVGEKREFVKEDGESTWRMKIEEFAKCLEEERSKIDAFRRELPLCFHIVKQVIDFMKEELMNCGSRVGNKNHPFLEQFLPIKSMFEEEKRIVLEKDHRNNKMDWIDSAQLGNSDTNSNKCGRKSDHLQLYRGISGISKEPEIEEKKVVSPLPDLSLVTPGINSSDTSTRSLPKEQCFYASNTKDEPMGSLSSSSNAPKNLHIQQQQNTSRKSRRSWSPELHEKFVTALNQLGGSHVATPKQIREMMKVDGLTNDEVKSHLQKYRLHVQRVRPFSSSRNEPVSYYDEGLIRDSPPFSRSA